MRSFSLPLSRLGELPIDLQPGMRIFLAGAYGSGKTALVRHLLQDRLGISEPITSPTYGYFHEYPGRILHFDLTRLPDYETFAKMGFEEYFDDPEATILTEWPEILANKIRPDLLVRIEAAADGEEREYRLFDRFDDADLLDGATDSPLDLRE
jgi:tRNA threonylcarbamoyl adenosine modification protein YjeE